jgi:hypothetical protein
VTLKLWKQVDRGDLVRGPLGVVVIERTNPVPDGRLLVAGHDARTGAMQRFYRPADAAAPLARRPVDDS